MSPYAEDLSLALAYISHGGTPEERDRVIERFEKIAATEDLPDRFAPVAHLILGIMLMLRVVHIPLGPSLSIAELFEKPPSVADLTDERVRSDLLRARASLARGVDGSDDLPEQVRSFAVLLTAMACLLETADSTFDPASMSELLGQALSQVTPGNAGHTELAALAAWSKASAGIEAGLPADTVLAELDGPLSALGEGHLLRPMVLAELAVDLAKRGETSGCAADLAAAATIMTSAWTDFGPHRDHPLWSQSLRRTAGITLTRAVTTSDPADIDEARRLADLVLDLPEDVPSNRFLVGMARLLIAYRDGDHEAYSPAIDDLASAAGQIDQDHEMWPVALAMLGATLSDEWLRRGGLENTEAADVYLRLAREHLQAVTDLDQPGGRDLLVIRGLSGLLRTLHGPPDVDRLGLAITDLAEAVAGLPDGHLLHSRLLNGLGTAMAMRGSASGDMDEVRKGAKLVTEAARRGTPVSGGQASMIAAGGLAALLVGALDQDRTTMAEGVALLRTAAGNPGYLPGEQVRLHRGLGNALVSMHDLTDEPDCLNEAVDALTAAADLVSADAANPSSGGLLRDLAVTLHKRGAAGDTLLAVETGLRSLAAFEEEVLLQTGAEHGLAVARGIAEFAREVAGWCQELGDDVSALIALERGRGLVLNAATAAANVPDVLRAAGHHRLADQWQHSNGGLTIPWHTLERREHGELIDLLMSAGSAPIPSDLRHRVLVELDRAGHRALPAPSPATMAAALRAVDMDALVYLIPNGEGSVAHLLVLRSGGCLERLAVADNGPPTPDDREALCDWAGATVMAPLLKTARTWSDGRPPRLVLVALDALGSIPWHAARWDGRHACQDAVISFIASGRQLADVARRSPRPPDADAVLVANPTWDLLNADAEVRALRAAHYPFARVYGPAQQDAAGPGRPDDVLAHLPSRDRLGASLLHLACHAWTGESPERSFLKLAASHRSKESYERLEISEVVRQGLGRPPDAPGGLVVLSSCWSDRTVEAHDEALTLATAFLAAGAATVVGSRWQVSDLRTAGLMFMFHRFLLTEPPADALRLAQLWMLDADRTYPDEMPARLREDLEEVDLTEVHAWAAFTHQGM
ncbi:CHAT domain-containing protein [Nonomuraea sp. NPDC050556]|uniref:CHAT domain-containing protein n=1 Tax=Nonomuraea sp. NPDC050556 TaxID=3364369 RepID=UPI0037BDEF9A